MNLCVRDIDYSSSYDIVCFYDFDILFFIFSDSIVDFVFLFFNIKHLFSITSHSILLVFISKLSIAYYTL